MKKLLRYLINTILFVVLWCLMFLTVMKLSIDTGGTSIAAIGGIIAIFISYALVKRINKSNLWAKLFDEAGELKDREKFDLFNKNIINEETNSNKKAEIKSSNIFNTGNAILAMLTLLFIFLLYFKLGGTIEDTNQIDNEGFIIIKNNLDLLTKDKLYSARAYTVRSTNIWQTGIYDLSVANLKPNESMDGEIYKLDLAIKEIGKAIVLESSNFYLYQTRAFFLRSSANEYEKKYDFNLKNNVYIPELEEKRKQLLRMALIDIEIALSIYPQGKSYTYIQEGCQDDSNCELAGIYMDRSIFKQDLGLNYCSDLKKACELESSISSGCPGQHQEDENCY